MRTGSAGRKLALLALGAFLLFTVSASSADTFAVNVVSETSTTITLGWSPQPGYGYLFSGDGQLVSRTNDPNRSSVRFSKHFSVFDIDVITKGANGHYPTAPPPPPKAQCEDGVDNDGDGKVDYPADPGCSSLTDNDETNVSPSGFPNAANTGVPSGTMLTTYTGPSKITNPNTVIDSKTMGCVDIETTGVVIRKSRISGKCFFMVDVTGGSRTSLTIEDSDVSCEDTPNSGLVGDDITAIRVNVHNCENGGSVDGNWDIRDSYIHDFFMNNPSTHSDGLQTFDGVDNVTIVHNTIAAEDEDHVGAQTATAAIIAQEPGHDNWSIANNKLSGAGFTVYCAIPPASNFVIRDNAFSNKPIPPAYGYSRYCGSTSGVTQSGNYQLETGQPLRLD